MATSNPAFSQSVLTDFGQDQVFGRSTVTTVQGTMGKTSLLLAIMSATAIWSWTAVKSQQLDLSVITVAAIAGLVLGIVTIFKPTIAPWTSPVYAGMQGVALGDFSQLVELRYGKVMPGIAFQAVMLTAGTLLLMVFLYANRIIVVTDRLRSGIIMATGALVLFYVVSMVLMFFGVGVPLRWSASPMGIAFSLFVVGLAAFNLLVDFDFIEEASNRQMPKYMEWYGAFGLLMTLIWLYIEILILLMKIASRRD